MANTTTTQLSVNIAGFYNRTLLGRLNSIVVHIGYSKEKAIPKNNGTQITWRRFGNLANATTALTEGVTPSGKQLSKTDYAATVLQYGDYVTITDWVKMVGLDNTLMEAAEILGDQAAQTLDVLMRDVMVAGTSVEYASSVTSRVTVDAVITAADIWKAENFLARNNAQPIRGRIPAGRNIATEGVDPCFIAIGHTDLLKDLEDISTFTPVRKYPSQTAILPGEVGKHGRVRFILTGNGKIISGGGATGTTFRNDGTSNDVYLIPVFADGAFGNSKIGPKSIENIVKPLGSGEDPLNQRCTSGWKASFVAKILSDLRVVRLEVACEDLSLDTAATSE